jgi:hypothetical protein
MRLSIEPLGRWSVAALEEQSRPPWPTPHRRFAGWGHIRSKTTPPRALQERAEHRSLFPLLDTHRSVVAPHRLSCPPELLHWPPFFESRPPPLVNAAGEHIPMPLYLSSLRSQPHRAPRPPSRQQFGRTDPLHPPLLVLSRGGR